MREAGVYCRTCERQTLHHQQPASNVVHVLISLLSCGIWLIVWAFLSDMSHRNPWRCTACGTEALICRACNSVATDDSHTCARCGKRI